MTSCILDELKSVSYVVVKKKRHSSKLVGMSHIQICYNKIRMRLRHLFVWEVNSKPWHSLSLVHYVLHLGKTELVPASDIRDRHRG